MINMIKTKSDLYIRFGADVKSLIKQVATSLGISQADYVRYTIKQDLKKRGLVTENATLETPMVR
jgi:uncharacterized ubiquitin-like protein YukD